MPGHSVSSWSDTLSYTYLFIIFVFFVFVQWIELVMNHITFHFKPICSLKIPLYIEIIIKWHKTLKNMFSFKSFIIIMIIIICHLI